MDLIARPCIHDASHVDGRLLSMLQFGDSFAAQYQIACTSLPAGRYLVRSTALVDRGGEQASFRTHLFFTTLSFLYTIFFEVLPNIHSSSDVPSKNMNISSSALESSGECCDS